MSNFKHLGIFKHPVHKEQGYDIQISENTENDIKIIILSWYDFSGDAYEFLNPEWAILKTNELFNEHHKFVSEGGGNGRNWIRLKKLTNDI